MTDLSVQVEALPENAGSIAVKICGPTNVSNVSVLLMRLLDAFERADNVTIDLSGVTEIDVAGLQLFCSCHRSSIISNKGFKITGQDQPAIWNAASSTGCLRKCGCALDTKHTCIWTGGGEC